MQVEPIYDLSWIKQMVLGEVVEKFNFHEYNVVAIKLSKKDENHHLPYFYRLLFFPENNNKPVLSLNLETSIMGAFFLTEHMGKYHKKIKTADEKMPYPEFREWALGLAFAELKSA